MIERPIAPFDQRFCGLGQAELRDADRNGNARYFLTGGASGSGAPSKCGGERARRHRHTYRDWRREAPPSVFRRHSAPRDYLPERSLARPRRPAEEPDRRPDVEAVVELLEVIDVDHENAEWIARLLAAIWAERRNASNERRLASPVRASVFECSSASFSES